MANNIGWCDKTLNPVVGCNIRCGDWCYARKQAKRQKQNCILCHKFSPHEHLERLKQLTPRQKPMKVFIDSMWDWNSPGVKPEWCRQIIAKMKECKQHIFLILSKKPEGFVNYIFPRNVWLGTSVTGKDDIHRIDTLLGSTHCDVVNRSNFLFVSFEPMIGEIPCSYNITRIDWIIIGGLSRQGKEPLQPKEEWVRRLLFYGHYNGIPIYTKDNLTIVEPRKEFPKAMEHTIRKVA